MTLNLFGDVVAPAPPTRIRQGFDSGLAPATPTRDQRDLSSYQTPAWVAEALVEQFYPHLTSSHVVVEPTCGTGRWLRAVPAHVPAYGIEIHAERAAEAIALSGRPVIVGDVLTAPLREPPTTLIGNPPFSLDFFTAMLDRFHPVMPADGEAGFIVPTYFLQTAHTVRDLARKWGLAQHLIPRNIFAGLEKPLAFLQLYKMRGRGMVGFALYEETAEVRDLPESYRVILVDGRHTTSVWAQLVDQALSVLGGEASTAAIIREATAMRDANLAESNRFPAQKIRQTLQRYFVQREPGRWARPAAQAA